MLSFDGAEAPTTSQEAGDQLQALADAGAREMQREQQQQEAQQQQDLSQEQLFEALLQRFLADHSG